VGSILLARIPDLYGRKKPMFISLAAQIPCYICMIISTSLLFTTIMACFFGIINVGIYNGAYVNICEYVHDPWKNHVCTFLLVFDSMTSIFVALYFKFVSQNWIWFQYLGLALSIIAFIGFYFLPESPEYLYSFYRFDECRKEIEKIAKWNKSTLCENYTFDVEIDLKNINFTK
jgi:MFS transporter, OCT family, solute carrier family 22 (organic cation transporter), member 4/5